MEYYMSVSVGTCMHIYRHKHVQSACVCMDKWFNLSVNNMSYYRIAVKHKYHGPIYFSYILYSVECTTYSLIFLSPPFVLQSPLFSGISSLKSFTSLVYAKHLL